MQKFPANIDWELLLIDNNSSDSTPQVAEAFTDKLPLRYVFEGLQGLSAARNRAVQEFKGDFLVFTDDDVELDSGWLAAWVRARSEFPAAEYFGGRILPRWDDGKPPWLKDRSMPLISGLLGQYDQGEADRWFIGGDPMPYGANFALRRTLTVRLAPFRVDLGVKGRGTGRGEETEYLERARNDGAAGAYVGSAVCYHVQDPSRLRLRFMYRYGVGTGRSNYRQRLGGQGYLLTELNFMLKGAVQLIKGHGDRFRQCIINAGIQRGLRLESSVHHRNKTSVRH